MNRREESNSSQIVRFRQNAYRATTEGGVRSFTLLLCSVAAEGDDARFGTRSRPLGQAYGPEPRVVVLRSFALVRCVSAFYFIADSAG